MTRPSHRRRNSLHSELRLRSHDHGARHTRPGSLPKRQRRTGHEIAFLSCRTGANAARKGRVRPSPFRDGAWHCGRLALQGTSCKQIAPGVGNWPRGPWRPVCSCAPEDRRVTPPWAGRRGPPYVRTCKLAPSAPSKRVGLKVPGKRETLRLGGKPQWKTTTSLKGETR